MTPVDRATLDRRLALILARALVASIRAEQAASAQPAPEKPRRPEAA